MSALTTFAAHCRTLAAAEHKPECPSLVHHRAQWALSGDGTRLTWISGPPSPACDGCNPPADRALFARMADEIGDYEGKR